MKTEYLLPTATGIDRAAALLREGKTVAIPTETVYGLAADAMDPVAVRAIFAAKGRPADNPLIVHIADVRDWSPLVKAIPEKAMRLAEVFWPGPLTIILPADPTVPSETTGGLSTVAVRFPSHPVAQAVILRSGRALAAPSANRSGAPSPTNAKRVMEDMDGSTNAVLEGGDSEVGVESTVVDLCHEPPRLLRPGGITPEMLEQVIGPIEIDPAVTHALLANAVAASPGMKYKHYAPKATVHLVKGSASAYRAFVDSHAGPGVMALCFDEDKEMLSVPAVTYGRRNDPVAQAQQIFDALRQLDEQGAVTVYAACPQPEGVGLAVYNRLLRAAAFSVISAVTVIGLTGPTGTGKSTVAACFKDRGAYIIDAEQLARQAVIPGSTCLGELTRVFSSAILREDGTLDRQELAKRAFSSPEQAQKLNAIIHPAVMEMIRSKLADAADQGVEVAVLDAPLLFEAGADALCHRIVAVLSPAEQRLHRIMERDGLDETAARRRMKAQPEDSFYCRPGVLLLYNRDGEADLCEAASRLWEERRGRWTDD